MRKSCAPLDCVGFHYYTRRIVSDAARKATDARQHFGTEIESDTGDTNGSDPYTQYHAVMPTEGPLTHAGLEVWLRGIYDLVTQISREYNHPIIEITECGCCYMDTPYDKDHGHVRLCGGPHSSNKHWPNWRARFTTGRKCAHSIPGASWTILNGPTAIASVTD